MLAKVRFPTESRLQIVDAACLLRAKRRHQAFTGQVRPAQSRGSVSQAIGRMSGDRGILANQGCGAMTI